jgi:hypothetical protein
MSAAAKLAIDGQIEHGQVVGSSIDEQWGADRWMSSLGENLGESASGRTRVGGDHQHDFRVGNQRKPVRRFEHAMIGQNRNLRQDADTETNRNSGLDASEIGTRICDVPRAADSFDGVDDSIAIEAALASEN